MHAVLCPTRGTTDTIEGTVLSALAAAPHHETCLSPGTPHGRSPPLSPQRGTHCSTTYPPPGVLHNTPSSADGLVLTPNGWRLGDSAMAESPRSPLGLSAEHRSSLSPRSPIAVSVAGLSLHGPPGYLSPHGSPYSPVRGVLGSPAGMQHGFMSPPGSPGFH